MKNRWPRIQKYITTQHACEKITVMYMLDDLFNQKCVRCSNVFQNNVNSVNSSLSTIIIVVGEHNAYEH